MANSVLLSQSTIIIIMFSVYALSLTWFFYYFYFGVWLHAHLMRIEPMDSPST